MKSIFLRAGLLTCLLLGLVNEETSAASEWSSKCTKFGVIEQNDNPDFQHINCLLTNAALDAEIPPEVVKAVAWRESYWVQFITPGKPNISSDGGIGIMQVTDIPEGYDENEKLTYKEKLKYDIAFNIEEGVKILNEKYNYLDKNILPKIQGAGRQEIENWYFPIMAYNGTKSINGPVYQSSGLKNTNAYQEKVFSSIERDSFLTGNQFLAQFPFKKEHFSYDTNNNIVFREKTYLLNDPLHTSVYFVKEGDDVVVTGGNGSLRDRPATSNVVNNLAPKNARLTVIGFTYTDKTEKAANANQYVWFHVKTKDGKSTGYISSANIKKLDSSWTPPVDNAAPTVPSVNEITDRSTNVTGKAEAGSTLSVKAGTKGIGTAKASTAGTYTVSIPKQKAGTKISVTATDAAGNTSLAKEITVKDATAPSTPTVNAVYDHATVIAGKAETNAKVYAMVGSKKIGETTAKNSAFSIKIAKQKAGTTILIYAVDVARNKSANKSVKVIDKTAPSTPSVSPVYDNATTISGKAETNAKVYAMVGTKKIGETTSKSGSYTVKIPKQKAGTSIAVYAKDASGNKSSNRIVKVIDKTAPPVPAINKITSKTVTVTGKSEKGASIYIYNGSKKIGQGVVDSRGNYKVKIKAQKKGSIIKVYAQDKSGNKSKSKTTKVS
ncbi:MULTISPECIES: Ig-like domain-containing protein [Peribacillus]|uniref:Ig-like domain-containing protein n=1 Tax=Peribacillus TaxID=2675229 RepID=UPI001F4DF0CC|nr:MULTISPECIES: Ig-like domain-containing protein [unclassified Peribacillus]MCK1984263.1 Ig-like domain-containing protein [Peribacillus sp. Aquil_B1]MCK2008434.1 Ig-like domain-containing protein [Peribacillus sp. Aquil_B8]